MSTRSRPPRWARWLAERLVGGIDREFVLGDLEQMYAARAGEGRRGAATVWFVLAALRTGATQLRSESLAGLGQDVRLAFRQFRRVWRVHASAAAVLAVGLGVAAFAWGIYYAEQIRGLQVPGGARVIELAVFERESGDLDTGLSVADFEAVLDGTNAFDLGALVGSSGVQLVDGARSPDRIYARTVTAGLFELIGARPVLGRLIDARDVAPGAPRVAVLGHDFWAERYESDPGIVGRAIRIDGEPTVVVGVLREGDRYLGADPLWLPLGAAGDRASVGGGAVMRVEEGVDRERVDAELAALSAGLAAERPEAWEGRVLQAVPFGFGLRGPHTSTKTRMIAWGGVLLYLMALANVANLFLVRARVRARELAIRRAVGAGLLRVMRQLAIEAALPAALGLAGGAFLADAGLGWYRAAARVYARGDPGPVWVYYGLERSHMLLLLAGALLSTVFVSLVAGVWELRRTDGVALRARGPDTGGFRTGKGLLAIEVAAGATLLLLAMLLLRGSWNLRTIDFGFATRSVMTGTVELGAKYPDAAARLAFFTELEADLSNRSGVEAVTLATQLPMVRYRGAHRIEVEGWDWDGAELDRLPVHYADFVTPGFFKTFERDVSSGRGFDSGDLAGSEPVVIVNEPFARRFYAGRSPIGSRVRVWNGDEPGPWRSIVGVAPDLWMDTDVNASPEGIYVPMAQAPHAWSQVALRVQGDPSRYAAVLREAVARLDPELPVLDVQTMPELIRMRTSLYRFQGPPFIAIGLAALFLAVAGLYAVVSYLASLRVAEFGIRAAVGASRLELMRRAAGTVAVPTLMGIVAGLALGMYVVRGFDRWLFQVDPWSPIAIGLTLGGLALSSVASALWPALRASRVDLRSVLRSD